MDIRNNFKRNNEITMKEEEIIFAYSVICEICKKYLGVTNVPEGFYICVECTKNTPTAVRKINE